MKKLNYGIRERISQKSKMSFKRFMHVCWENSQTNLHYTDYVIMYESQMKTIFTPTKKRELEE